MTNFEIGEIAIIYDPGNRLHLEEVIITGAPFISDHIGLRGRYYPPELVYPIKCSAEQRANVCAAADLRKKRPPQDWQAICFIVNTPQPVAEEA
jgi:hypothetical protein